MKEIYYDTIEKFVEDIKKKIDGEVAIQKNENIIIIDNEEISYKEENVGLRSFSIPYF